jgi:hypothetical protein
MLSRCSIAARPCGAAANIWLRHTTNKKTQRRVIDLNQADGGANEPSNRSRSVVGVVNFLYRVQGLLLQNPMQARVDLDQRELCSVQLFYAYCLLGPPQANDYLLNAERLSEGRVIAGGQSCIIVRH